MYEGGIKTNLRPQEFYARTAPPGFEIPGSATVCPALSTGRDLYRVISGVTRGIFFFGFIQRTGPFSRSFHDKQWILRAMPDRLKIKPYPPTL